MELWKHYDSTHTRRHTPVHLHTRTRSLRTGPYSCIIQKGALSATLFVKKKKPAARVAFMTLSLIHRASKGQRSAGTRCRAQARRVSRAQHTLPSASRAGVNSGQHPALSCSALIPASASAHAAERRVVGGRRHISPLGHRQRSLLAMVHVPKAVKLCKVHVGLHAPVLIGLQRVRGAGAEETPIRAGAAALRVGVGRLESHSGALAGERENTGIFILPHVCSFAPERHQNKCWFSTD